MARRGKSNGNGHADEEAPETLDGGAEAPDGGERGCSMNHRPEVEIAILRSRCWGRVDVAYEYAVEHLLDADSRGRTAPELCAALGEQRPQASWEEALWLVAEYASAGMRAAQEMSRETR